MNRQAPWWKQFPQQQIYHWSVLPSTHQEALSWIENHLINDQTWVWFKAHRQNQGVGQFSRSFFSPLGGIYATLICTWPTQDFFPVLPLAVGLAIVDALPISCQLKWVNDIYKGTHKLGGILITRLVKKDQPIYLISCGLNVNSMFSLGIEGKPVTSVKKELGYSLDLERLWEGIEMRLYKRLIMALSEDKTSLIQDLNAHLLYRGEQVYIRTPGGWFNGIFEGIVPSGKILLEGREIDRVLSVGKTPLDMT